MVLCDLSCTDAGDVGAKINMGAKNSQIIICCCKEALRYSWSAEYPGRAGSCWESPVTIQMQSKFCISVSSTKHISALSNEITITCVSLQVSI